jgi:hypothetical protein
MIKILLAVVLIIALLVLGPFAIIWSLGNIALMIKSILEGVGDPYTWQNWVSVIFLGAFISPNVTIKRKNG